METTALINLSGSEYIAYTNTDPINATPNTITRVPKQFFRGGAFEAATETTGATIKIAFASNVHCFAASQITSVVGEGVVYGRNVEGGFATDEELFNILLTALNTAV